MKRFSEIFTLAPTKQQLVSREMLWLSQFFFISVSETSYRKNLHTKKPPPHLNYNVKEHNFNTCSWNILTMLHFLYEFNPIYPLKKNTVKFYWISLNNCIISKSWKYFLTYHVNIDKVKQWMTNYSRML